jgi:hypothetical protein
LARVLYRAPTFTPQPRTRALNEDPPHRFRGGGEEMRSIGEPAYFALASHAQPGFMDERSPAAK